MRYLLILTSLLILLTSSYPLQAADTFKQVNSGIPSALRSKLIQFLGQKRQMDVVVSTKEGHWILIGRGVHYYSSGSFFDRMTGSGSTSLRQIVKNYVMSGKRIDALGITHDNNWVLTSGNLRFYSSASKFDQMRLRPAIERQISRGQKIEQIAIAKNNSWAMISEGRVFISPNIPADLKKAVMDAQKQKLAPRLIKFRPDSNQWIFIAGQKTYASKDLSRAPFNWIAKYRALSWETNEVFFAPGNGWAVISNNTINKNSNALPDKVQWNVAGENIWQRMEYHKAAAVSIAYMVDGRAQWLRTYGYADKEQNRQAYYDTRFGVASISKAVGSFAMIRAAEKGIVNLDKTLKQYINENPSSYLGRWGRSRALNDNPSARRSERTTIRRLLTHSAGLSKHGIGIQKTPIASLEDILDGTHGKDSVNFTHSAGVSFKYSGGGYSVAESILDVSYHKGATAWLNETLKLLGMNDSTFGTLENDLNTLARLHDKDGEVYIYRECPGKMAGGLFTTPYDYSLFLSTILNEGKTPRGKQVVSGKWNREMFTPAHREGSSLKFCNNTSGCTSFESCVANICMRPIQTSVGSNKFHTPGINAFGRFDQNSRRPEAIEHGGAQLSTSTQFLYNVNRNLGIVVFVTGPTSWKNDPDDDDEKKKGSHTLKAEIVQSFRKAVAW